MRTWPLLLLPFLALAAAAQNNPPAKPGTGTVTGHVYCADTNAPARMASVQLESVKDADRRSNGHLHSSGMPVGGVVQTGIDGSFVFSKVAPGSYYVVAIAAGYLSPRANGEDFDDAEPTPPAGRPPIVVPKVDVEADQTAGIDIRLERGAAVSGTIRFDDGSPAPGVHVTLLHKHKDEWVPSQQTRQFSMGELGQTDDLGHYRISGLRDREYLLMTTLTRMDVRPIGEHGSAMTAKASSIYVYTGGTPHRSQAVPFKLGAGEEHTGEDITIPLSKFHTISGVVTAARDGHPIDEAFVQITEPDHDSPITGAEIGDDGTFRLECVPEGSYLLRVKHASDQLHQEITGPQNATFINDKTLHQYGDLEQTIKVEGDIPNLVLAVPEVKNQAAGTASH